MLLMIIAWFQLLVWMGREILNDTHGEFTESEKQFLTLNPVEWTRNNYPIFCRMYKGELSDVDDEEEENDIPIRIIKHTRVKLNTNTRVSEMEVINC